MLIGQQITPTQCRGHLVLSEDNFPENGLGKLNIMLIFPKYRLVHLQAAQFHSWYYNGQNST